MKTPEWESLLAAARTVLETCGPLDARPRAGADALNRLEQAVAAAERAAQTPTPLPWPC